MWCEEGSGSAKAAFGLYSVTSAPEGFLRYFRAIGPPVPISRAEGKIFSTNPHVVLMAGEGEFVIKGPDTRVVFAESAAYELATRIGIDVPEHGLCRLPGDAAVHFCCRKLRGRFPVDYWIDHERLVNRSLVPETIAFDVWTGNHDRNMGNFVEDEAKDAQGDFGVKLYAIDFEKAAILRESRTGLR